MTYEAIGVTYDDPRGTYDDLDGVAGTATPFLQDVPPVSLYQPEIDANPLGYRLFRHYGMRTRGVNIYQWEDGTFHQSQVWEGDSYVTLPGGVVIDTPAAHTVIRTIFGGHNEPLDDATLAALIAANYGFGQ